MDNIYFDEETGQLMQSVTVPGGDVIQLPYEKEEEQLKPWAMLNTGA